MSVLREFFDNQTSRDLHNQTEQWNQTALTNEIQVAPATEEAPPLPDYVCCAITEGVWTWFSAFLLSFFLFMVATLRYCRKLVATPSLAQKGRELHLQHVYADDKGKSMKSVRIMPISTDEFKTLYERRRKNPMVVRIEFRKIFESIKKHQAVSAEDSDNAKLNQNQMSIPYDHNRVVLKDGGDAKDYINASYVRDHHGKVAWIVTQGPTDRTIVDFWHLAWQEKSPLIVMLTRTFEFIQMLCSQYWPKRKEESVQYGPYTITIVQEECFSDHEVRILLVEKGNRKRQITLYQFLEWNLESTPEPFSLVRFHRSLMRECKILQRGHLNGPMIVHCHDGGHRTGSFLAIIDNLTMADEFNRVDVFGTLMRLAEERRGLLSMPGQITYIYDVLYDHFICGETHFPTHDILKILQAKSKKSGEDNLNDYQREHRLLCSLIPRFTIGDCTAGHLAENRYKNRNFLIVPPDKHRPYLTSFISIEATNYINAVFVDGYRKLGEFICTEWPMSNTLQKFWSLVYDHDINTIVVLNNHKGSVAVAGINDFPSFWPKHMGKVKKYGNVFSLEQISCQNYDRKFSCYELNLMKKDLAPHRRELGGRKNITDVSCLIKTMDAPSRVVRLFQFDCWPNNQRVPNSTFALVHFIDEVDKWRKSNNPNGEYHEDRIVVVSDNGYSRCGVYCTAAAALEQVYRCEEVDVFQMVKAVRKNRPQMIASAMEYKYCYDVVLHYVLNYVNPKKTKKK